MFIVCIKEFLFFRCGESGFFPLNLIFNQVQAVVYSIRYEHKQNATLLLEEWHLPAKIEKLFDFHAIRRSFSFWNK